MRSRAQRQALLGIGIAVTAAIAAGIFFAARAVTQQENAGQVNGVTISTAQLADAETVTARVRGHDPSYSLDVAGIARQQVDYAEAQRRGFACTTSEAQQQLAATVQTAQKNGQVDGLLQVIEDSGLAPAGYHLTPEAGRTPDTQSVIDAYSSDPDVVSGMQPLCAVGKLMTSVEATAQPPAGTQVSGQPPNAVATFRASIYARATVIGADGKAIDIRYPTRTPTP